MSAPLQPYTGSSFFIQLDGGTVEQVLEFVKKDPYVEKGLVDKYTVEPVIMTHTDKEFERMAGDFINRS